MSKAKYHIRIDALDPDSIEAGLYLLQRYKKYELQDIVTTFPAKLCEIAADAAREAYQGQADVSWYVKGTGNGVKGVISAKGREVCFLEFGTGVYADPGHPFADSSKLGFLVYPGSWSEGPEGQKTWSSWINSGKSPETYPYNREPTRAMEIAYNTILFRLQEVAKEVFQ